MNDEWAYVGAATLGPDVSFAVARPRWALYASGRKPRGEWQAEILNIKRQPRADFVEWLGSSASDQRTPLGASPHGTVLLDISEVGGGDLLLRSVNRAIDRIPILRRARMLALDVTPRDVERSPRVIARRDVLAPFLDALERDVLVLPKGALSVELVNQYDALTRKPDAVGGREDLVRAVALCVWAIDLEGRSANTGGAMGAVNVY